MFNFKVDRKTFKVDVDLDDLLVRANALKDGYEGIELNITTELKAKEEDYNEDMVRLINYIQAFKDNNELLLTLVVNAMPRKKDGWLYKGRINHIVVCENTARDSDGEYGYRAYTLKAKNISLDTISIRLVDDIFKY